VRADVLEELGPQQDAVDPNEILLKVDQKRDVLELGRSEFLDVCQHIRLNVEGCGDSQIENGEEQDEVDNVHGVPEVFEIFFGTRVINFLGFLYYVEKHLGKHESHRHASETLADADADADAHHNRHATLRANLHKVPEVVHRVLVQPHDAVGGHHSDGSAGVELKQHADGDEHVSIGVIKSHVQKHRAGFNVDPVRFLQVFQLLASLLSRRREVHHVARAWIVAYNPGKYEQLAGVRYAFPHESIADILIQARRVKSIGGRPVLGVCSVFHAVSKVRIAEPARAMRIRSGRAGEGGWGRGEEGGDACRTLSEHHRTVSRIASSPCAALELDADAPSRNVSYTPMMKPNKDNGFRVSKPGQADGYRSTETYPGCRFAR
jgi:hypothetical protein